jgi:hypothetical protein
MTHKATKLIERYSEVIDRAVRHTLKFCDLSADDLRSIAVEYVLSYGVGLMSVGKIAKTITPHDNKRMDRYVQQALDCDLIDYLRKDGNDQGKSMSTVKGMTYTQAAKLLERVRQDDPQALTELEQTELSEGELEYLVMAIPSLSWEEAAELRSEHANGMIVEAHETDTAEDLLAKSEQDARTEAIDRDYPLLAMYHDSGLSTVEMGVELDLAQKTTWRRIQKQEREFSLCGIEPEETPEVIEAATAVYRELKRFIQSKGITVDGTETIDELREAAKHLYFVDIPPKAVQIRTHRPVKVENAHCDTINGEQACDKCLKLELESGLATDCTDTVPHEGGSPKCHICDARRKRAAGLDISKDMKAILADIETPNRPEMRPDTQYGWQPIDQPDQTEVSVPSFEPHPLFDGDRKQYRQDQEWRKRVPKAGAEGQLVLTPTGLRPRQRKAPSAVAWELPDDARPDQAVTYPGIDDQARVAMLVKMAEKAKKARHIVCHSITQSADELRSRITKHGLAVVLAELRRECES